MSLPGLTRQSRHSGTARISAFTRVFDALCAGPGIQMHALSSFWIPGSLASLAPRNDRKTIHIFKQPAFAEGFRLRADALRRTKTRRSSLASGGGYGGQANAPPPCFFAAPGTPSSLGKIRIARKKNRGRAGRQGSKRTRGPRRLATSRLVEVLVPRLSLWFERSAKRAASPPNPRRPARGV